MTDHYQTLGISENASQEEIKAAFRRLAVKYHPDKHGGHSAMEESFKRINEAYQVLSNPYEKTRYDLKRQFDQVQYTVESEPVYHYSPRPAPVREEKINWRENWIATGYAFGFTLIMAIIVMSGIKVREYMHVRTLESRLAERRSIFQGVQNDYQNGKVEAALTSLNDLGVFRTEEKDMEEYKELLYIEFLDKAEKNYDAQQYGKAIYYLELINTYGSTSTYMLDEQLANAYKQSGQLDKAIKKYKELLIAKYHPLNTYFSLATIYHINLGQPEEALRYYELANLEAVKYYKSIYGEAYPFVLSANVIPKKHYFLYAGLAKAYLETNNPERALKATKWNISIWPNGMENYVTAAKSFHQTGQEQLACDALSRAVYLGFNEDIGFSCN